MKNLVLLGRICFALLFIMSASGHFSAETINNVAAKVPFASVLVPLSGVMELLGALGILLGYKAKWGAWLIVLFLIPVTLTLHQFWTIEDPMAQRMDMVNFMKNIALLGSALLIAYFGSGPMSLDAIVQKKPVLAH
jgi:putative oxidoreductase